MDIKIRTASGKTGTIQANTVEELQEQIALTQQDIGEDVTLDSSVSGGESGWRGGVQGATLGFGDEIAGAASALFPGGQDYRESRDESRLSNYIAQKANPKTYMGAEFGGSMLLPGGAAGTVARNTGRLAKAGKYALAGGVGGGVGALGLTDELDAQGAKDTAIGAGVGALLGPVAGYGGEKAADLIGGTVRAGRRAIDSDPEYGANWALRQALPDEINTPELLRANVDAQGPDSRLINMDDGMLALAQQARQGGPQSSRVLSDGLNAQREGAVMRLQEGVREAFPESRHTSLPELNRALKDGTRARELYDAAYQRTYIPSDTTRRQFEQSETFKDVAGKVEEGFLDRDVTVGMPVGGVLPEEVSIEYMHRYLAMLRGKVDETFRTGNRNHAQDLKETYQRLDQEVKRQVPEFAEAQQYYRSKMDIKAASEVGRDIFKGKTQDYELEDIMEGWSQTENKAFQVGLMQSLLNRVDEITDTGNTGSKVLNNPRVRKLVKQGLGPNASDKIDNLIELAKQEQSKSRTHSRLLNNSSTGDVLGNSRSGTEHEASTLGALKFLLDKITKHEMTSEEWARVTEKLLEPVTDESARKILRRPISEEFRWLSPLATSGAGAAGYAGGTSEYATGIR